tara:strand:+ start:1797 stop:1952 length:156 start_codon:yes stop_codon:yes gene_type:complete
MEKIRDIIFFTFVGLGVIIIFGWITLIFLPYYIGREVWQRYENWYINKGRK